MRGDFDENSSDEEENILLQMVTMSSNQQNQQEHGHVGSVVGRAFICRDRAAADERIYTDYFSTYPLFGEKLFRRRFRMPKPLFERILVQLQDHDNYFKLKYDAVGATGLSGIRKMTASLRMLLMEHRRIVSMSMLKLERAQL